MAMITCPECDTKISEKATTCPKCGYPLRTESRAVGYNLIPWLGYEWKSKTTVFGLPLVHIAIGRNRETGQLMLAKGIIAIGQFAVGLVTIAQFGLGILFGLGQFMAGFVTIGQFALGVYFGLGQFATGYTVIGQFAFGTYVRAQLGYGKYIWSSFIKDTQAIQYFNRILGYIGLLVGR